MRVIITNLDWMCLRKATRKCAGWSQQLCSDLMSTHTRTKDDGTPFIEGNKKIRIAAIDEDGGESVLEVSLTVTDQPDNSVAMVDVD